MMDKALIEYNEAVSLIRNNSYIKAEEILKDLIIKFPKNQHVRWGIRTSTS